MHKQLFTRNASQLDSCAQHKSSDELTGDQLLFDLNLPWPDWWLDLRKLFWPSAGKLKKGLDEGVRFGYWDFIPASYVHS